LPEALAWIQYEPGWRDWLCNNLPSEITENHYVDVWLARPKVNAEYATFAFWILGTNAASTIPKLESMLHDPREETVIQAIDALGSIGSPALPLLQAALADTNQSCQSRIIKEFHSMVTIGHSNTYLPLIVDALSHKNQMVRDEATNALAQLAPHLLTNAPTQ
jgi:hypothetical protein